MLFRVVILVLLAAAAPGLAGSRVALLIGMGDYANPDLALPNPANDVAAMERALLPLGFAVTSAVNADRATLSRTLEAFEADMAGADTALVFFAGHGVQLEGENHLLTAGLDSLSLEAVARESVTLTELRQRFLRARPDFGVIVLDACRNNPFTDTGQAARGLARSQGGAGLLIAYATDPGNVAYDGRGASSVFTTALAANIGAPGVEARLMFGRVRQQVLLDSGGRQIPWVEESVLGEHFFNPSQQTRLAAIAADEELGAWRAANAAGTRDAYRDFLTHHPRSIYAAFARERLDALDRRDTAAGAPGGDLGALVATADPARLRAALEALGFLLPGDGAEAVPAALAAYAAQLPEGSGVTMDGLLADAARMTVLLAAHVGQRLRTDLGALKASEINLATAEGLGAQMAALDDGTPEIRAVLDEVAAALADIRAKREVVLTRLDTSRARYEDLLDAAAGHFGPWLGRALESVSGGALAGQGMAGDAEAFVRHAEALRQDDSEGSYGWLADFLPGQ